jgi:hypothetical protein
MKHIINTLIFLISFNISLVAQQQGNINIHQSSAINRLLIKHIQVNEYHPWVEGYRVQLYSISGVNSRDKANTFKAKFLLKHKNAKIYIVYHSPYYKVRLGDFRTKIEALAYLQTITKEYPSGFVVVDKIKFKENDSTEEETNE